MGHSILGTGLLAAATLAMSAGTARAADESALNVPFAFQNDSFGFAAGYVYGLTGYPQPQSTVLGTVMAGTQGSVMGFGMLKNYRLPFADRLLVDLIAQVGDFKNVRSYTDGNPDFAGETAGINESDADNYIEGDGFDAFFRANLRYLLPVGAGAQGRPPAPAVERGLPAEDGAPAGAAAFVELRPFYRSQEVESDAVDRTLRTNGADLTLLHDSRDFVPSPAHGGARRLVLSRDFGAFDSSAEWTVVSLELDQYFSLGASENFRQRVIALDVWTADSPSWDDTSVEDGQVVFHRAPAYTGATLGGLFRMRGYPAARFHDQAAMYYSGEVRLMPRWNPFDAFPRLQQHVGVQWWQWVAFAEVGRVAPAWSWSGLHEDMKWSAGLGVRALAKGITVRVDVAASEEEFKAQMMIGQPFQF